MYVSENSEMNANCNYVAKVIVQKCWFYFDNKAIYND